ncbi:RNA polymerase II-associated protein 3-like isoform X1 [Macrobrachium nipponense]|uniref:RNA polymerase II-associated protein 3-like isoform X1 n=1 Tax=Macrobrachium nipponense TaxID=159736 RepID=UPI0030C88FAD
MSEVGPSIKLQKEIKENSLEVQDFIADLRQWEKDVKENECRESRGREEKTQVRQWVDPEFVYELPPVRCRKSDVLTRNIITDNRKRKEEREPDMKKKERISSYDYAAWDRFDVSKALESDDDDDKELPSETSESQTTEISSHSSNKTPSLSKKERAVKLKDEGNKHYSNNRLEDAIAKYTQGMALDPTNPILPANRAMAYIKLEKYEAAELDCSRCLKLDPSYIKAYLRRGTSRLKLGKIQRATEDFQKVLELEPWNKDAKKELENIAKQIDVSSNKEKLDQEKKSPQSGKKLIAETSANTTSQKFEKSSEKTMVSNESTETKQKIGKKIRITEVGCSSDLPSTISLSEGSEAVMPIVKSPHQRSQKPLKKITVLDVPSPESLPKKLPSCSVPKESRVEDVPNSVASEVRAIENSANSRDRDVVAAKNAQNKLETQAVVPLSVPPVPRTSYQFSQDWQRISRHQSHAVEYLKAIQPSFFHNIDLEMEVFVDFVSALRWNEFSPEEVASYLSALARSDGFGVNLMFLDDKQKKVFREVVDKCKCQGKLHTELISKLKANSL